MNLHHPVDLKADALYIIFSFQERDFLCIYAFPTSIENCNGLLFRIHNNSLVLFAFLVSYFDVYSEKLDYTDL